MHGRMELNKELSQELKSLLIADSSSLELQNLQLLRKIVEDSIAANAPEENNCCDTLCDSVISQDNINSLMRYSFSRKFSGAEAECDQSSLNLSLENERFVSETLDIFLTWILSRGLCRKTIHGFIFCLHEAQQQPVVRHQTALYLMEWLSRNTRPINSQTFPILMEAMVLSLTDVWSAVRKSCAGKLSPVMECFSLNQLAAFFSKLVSVCLNEETTWQAKDGALQGMNVVVRHFKWTGCLSGETTDKPDNSQTYVLLFGQEEVAEMPGFITRSMQSAIFSLLAHRQLSIREMAVKVYTSYIARCDVKVAWSSLQSLVNRLHAGCNFLQTEDGELEVTDSALTFLDAYEAESLLNVAVQLIKHIPPAQFCLDWSLYISTFSAYLQHPASTVRQATSVVFKFLVAKNCSSPGVLQMVLSELGASWIPDDKLLSQNLDLTTPTHCQQKRVCVTELTASSPDMSQCWQWREGRLLTYELILQFLIKNHLLYTFGNLATPTSSDSDQKSTNERGLDKMGQSLDISKVTREQDETEDEDESMDIEVSHPPPPPLHRLSVHAIFDGDEEELNFLASIKQQANSQSDHASVSVAESSQIKPVLPAPTARRQTVSEAGTHLPLSRHYSYLNSTPVKRTTLVQPESLLASARSTEQSYAGMQSGLSSLLTQIFCQTLESLADERWELRRMGQQLLGCVVEVMRWYDMTLLESLWLSQLGSQSHTSLLTYGALTSFLYSVQHASKLRTLQITASKAWLSGTLFRDIVKNISSVTQCHLESALNTAHFLLRRSVFDKLSVVAIHVFLLTYSHYHDTLSTNQIAKVHYTSLRDVWWKLFVASHPDEENLKISHAPSEEEELDSNHSQSNLQHHPGPTYLTSDLPFLTPTEGFLCCCIRTEASTKALALQCEKYLVTEVIASLPGFLHICPPAHSSVLLSILITYMRYYVDLDTSTKHIMESVSVAVQSCQNYLQDELRPDTDPVVLNCSRALQQISHTLATNGVDLQVTRCLLDHYMALTNHMPASHHVTQLITALLTRLQVSKPHSSPTPVSGIESTGDHISVFTESQQDEDSTDGDDVDLANCPDTQLLNLSGGSGMTCVRSPRGTGAGRVSLEAEQEEGSDWDDWSDDENEDDESISLLLSDFYKKFHRNMVANKENKVVLDSALLKLSSKNRMLLDNLIAV